MVGKVGNVYMITNQDGKIYIGSSVNTKKRFNSYNSYNCKRQIKLYRSLVKYGVENHIFEVIWSGDIENMLYYEAIIGLYFEVLDKGLNCSLPKISDIYKCISNDTKNKMSKSKIGRFFSNETKLKMSISSKGVFKSEEHKNKIRNSHFGKKHTEESKLKMKEVFKGRIVTNETKLKISNSLKGENHYNFGKKLSNETKNKLSESLKGKTQSKEWVEKRIISKLKNKINNNLDMIEKNE